LLDATTEAFLESGCGLVVCAVSPDGMPCVARGWGLTVLDPYRGLIRLLVPSDDATLLEHLGDGERVAVTGGDVRTYRSIQLKGRSRGVEEATEADRARLQAYIAAFFAELLDVNAMPAELCERFIPVGVSGCTLVVEELYDQTPGPGAGLRLETTT
jgi:hypothetical protein